MSEYPTEYKALPFVIPFDQEGNLYLAKKEGDNSPCMRAIGGAAQLTNSDIQKNDPSAIMLAAETAVKIFNKETNTEGIITIDEKTPFTVNINCFVGKPNNERKETSNCRHSMIYFYVSLSNEQISAIDKGIRENTDPNKKHASLWKLCDSSKYEEWKQLGSDFTKLTTEQRKTTWTNGEEVIELHPEAGFVNSFL